jgi:hypothetical protein
MEMSCPALLAPSLKVFIRVATLSPMLLCLQWVGPLGPVYCQSDQQIPEPASLVLKKNVWISGTWVSSSATILVNISCVSFTLTQGANAGWFPLLGWSTLGPSMWG